MREKANQVEYDDDQYHYGESGYSTAKKRLDLNDLLQRVKNQKRDEKKRATCAKAPGATWP